MFVNHHSRSCWARERLLIDCLCSLHLLHPLTFNNECCVQIHQGYCSLRAWTCATWTALISLSCGGG